LNEAGVPQNVEKCWEEFWRPIVTNPDGSLSLDAIKRELFDFRVVMEEVSKVYYELTAGQISKPNTDAEWVLLAVDKARL
jgi:hypothetical protein